MCGTLRPSCGRATAAAEPIGAAEFADLMAPLGPFTAGRSVAVAVSGGADSLALALLLSRWGRPFAAIVDHGLRPESAAEAAITARLLAGFGVASTILRAALPPGPAAAERARNARYRLLLDACREAGCADLLLAHHQADQAETVRMRQDAGSRSRGLAGMAAIAYREQARLLRPLLPIAPARLRATLSQAGIAWVEDPTNRDQRTLRARLRAAMDGPAMEAALCVGRRHGLARAEAERGRAGVLGAVRFHPAGFALIPDAIDEGALSAVIWAVSGRRYPPPRLAGGVSARTLHGVLLRPAGALGPGVLVAREPGAVAAPERAAPGVRWDGRFRLGGALPDGLTIGALGDDSARIGRRSRLPAVVRRTLPALRRDGRIVAVPHLGFPEPASCPSVSVWFCPACPAAGAPFVNTSPNKGV